MTASRHPRPGHLDPPSPSPSPSPSPRKPDTEALRAALDALLADPGPDVHDLFPCLRDGTDSNRLGKDGTT